MEEEREEAPKLEDRSTRHNLTPRGVDHRPYQDMKKLLNGREELHEAQLLDRTHRHSEQAVRRPQCYRYSNMLWRATAPQQHQHLARCNAFLN